MNMRKRKFSDRPILNTALTLLTGGMYLLWTVDDQYEGWW